MKARKYSSILILALIMALLAAVPGALAAKASDIEGHWAQSTIETWLEKEWIQGYPDGTFRPDAKTTRAEITVLINRAFGFTEISKPGFTDVNDANWFYDSVGTAVNAGYISGYPDQSFKPNNPMTRQEFAVILNSLLELPAGDASKLPADAKNAPEWSRDAIAAVYGVGLITGYQDGTFRPQGETTRAEVVVMLQRALPFIKDDTPIDTIDPLEAGVIEEAGYYGGTRSSKRIIDGDLEIKTDGVTLQNVTVKGNLLLAASIGEGDVTLKNVTVEGTTTIQGGGANSIYVEDSTLVNVVVDKENGTVRVVVKGLTNVASVSFQRDGKLEVQQLNGTIQEVVLSEQLPEGAKIELVGNIDTVTVLSPNVSLAVSQGSIKQLNVAEGAENVSIDLASGVQVAELIVNAAAKVTGQGTIEKAEINNDKAEVEADVKETVGEEKEPSAPGGSTPPPPASGGTPGGGTPGGGVIVTPPTLQSMTVTVNDAVYYDAARVGGTFTFVIPADIDELDMITAFEIKGSNNAQSLTINGKTIEFENGVASATVSQMLGALDPAGDGVSVKTLVANLLEIGSDVYEVTGALVGSNNSQSTYRFVIDASNFVKLMPEVTGVSVTVGGQKYAAQQSSPTKFTFTIPADVNDSDMVTAFEIAGNAQADTISFGAYTVEFKNGVAASDVSEILGELDPQGDGISVKTAKQMLEETTSVQVKVVSSTGKTKTYTIEFVVE